VHLTAAAFKRLIASTERLIVTLLVMGKQGGKMLRMNRTPTQLYRKVHAKFHGKPRPGGLPFVHLTAAAFKRLIASTQRLIATLLVMGKQGVKMLRIYRTPTQL